MEKMYFLDLEFAKRDEDSTQRNGKRPYVQDCIGGGKNCYNIFPLMCEVRGVSAMVEIHYKQPISGVMGN